MIDHIMCCPVTHDILQKAMVAAHGHTYTRTAYAGPQVRSNGDGRLQDQVADGHGVIDREAEVG